MPGAIRRVGVFIFITGCLFIPSLLSAKELILLQREQEKQAQFYRKKGLELQHIGHLNEAMVYYQKAITLDPEFVIAYNDLGIIYEAKGWQDQAEEVYLAALEIDHNYPNLYSNLAMLCEKKGDYRRAVEFWQRRIELGNPDDFWVKKAKERLVSLKENVPELRQEYLLGEAGMLSDELTNQLREKRLNDLAEAKKLFDEAKLLYQNAQYEEALNNIDSVLSLNPENKEELLNFRDEVEKKRGTRISEMETSLLRLKEEIEKKAHLAEMEIYFQNSMTYYQQDNLHEAKKELDKITAVITPFLKE